MLELSFKGNTLNLSLGFLLAIDLNSKKRNFKLQVQGNTKPHKPFPKREKFQ
jgi:hypothetical protein